MDTAVNQAPTPAVSAPLPSRASRRNRSGSDTLAVLWYPGGFSVAVLRRASLAAIWSAPAAPGGMEDFASALDEGLSQIDFSGNDAVLVLEHPAFRHNYETLPPLSEGAARNFLSHRVEREQPADDPLLWVPQSLASPRKELACMLHLLPTSLFRALNAAFLSRQLDLTRVIPVTVPLALLAGAPPADKPMLVAAELGDSVCCTVIGPKGDVFMNRILMAAWATESDRIGIEVNRSALFIKQRFGLPIGEVRLLGRATETTSAEVTRRCPPGTTVTHRECAVKDWLEAVVRVPQRHPVNLLAGYLTHKRQVQLWRKGLIAAAWIGVAFAGLSAWGMRQQSEDQTRHYAQLSNDREKLHAERERLTQRNAVVDRDREIVNEIATTRPAPIPAQAMAALASTAPTAIDLTDCLVRFDVTTGKWLLRVSGQIRSDEFSAPEILNNWMNRLAAASPRLQFPEAARNLSTGGADNPNLQRFSAEGGLLEP